MENLKASQAVAENEPQEKPVIEISNLTKRYGNKTAVDNISFSVNKGEIIGFLGPNGAGKTTTMNIITGYISYNSGNVKVDGAEVLERPLDTKKHIGYLPENPPLYLDMTVTEYLNFVYDLKKVKLNRKQHLAEVMGLVALFDVKERLIKNLSKGYRQRVGLAQALLGNPEVLILDEPTIGLDPKQIIEIRNMIKALGKNRTVILSTHILPEVSAICDKVIIINKGRIVAMDTTANLSETVSGKGKYILRATGNKHEVQSVIEVINGVKHFEYKGELEPGSAEFEIETKKDVDIRFALFEGLAKRGKYILMLKPLEMTLEEVFIRLTSEDGIKFSDEEIAPSEQIEAAQKHEKEEKQ